MGTCNYRIHIHRAYFPQNLCVSRRHDIVTKIIMIMCSARMNGNCCHLDQESLLIAARFPMSTNEEGRGNRVRGGIETKEERQRPRISCSTKSGDV